MYSKSFVGEPKQPVVVKVPVHGKPTELDITAEMRRACESLLGPISETMLDLVCATGASAEWTGPNEVRVESRGLVQPVMEGVWEWVGDPNAYSEMRGLKVDGADEELIIG